MDNAHVAQARRSAHPSPSARIDWAREAKLAIALSALAALFAIALAGRVSDRVVVTTVIVAASLVAWRRVEPPSTRATVPVRRR